jgi:hypothetical protein
MGQALRVFWLVGIAKYIPVGVSRPLLIMKVLLLKQRYFTNSAFVFIYNSLLEEAPAPGLSARRVFMANHTKSRT